MDNFIFVHVKSEIIIIITNIIFIVNFPIALYWMAFCYNRRQDNTMQYTTMNTTK